jgi:tetratricopeptide (TPR) repeat protein
MKVHPHDELIRQASQRQDRGLDRVLEHVASCAKCRARLAHPNEDPAESYEPALGRSLTAVRGRWGALEQERAEAPSLFGSLVTLDAGQQRLLVSNSRRFQTWGLCELLIARGKEETYTDARHAEDLLHLAVAVSAHLSPASYAREFVEDLRARCWGAIANARRCQRDLTASEEAFEEAFARLRRGTEDPLEKATLFHLQASLRRDQQRAGESLRLSRRAIAVFQRLGQTEAMARAFISSSIVHAESGDLSRSVQDLNRSLQMIEPTREPRLALVAANNLAADLAAAGRLLEARRVLLQARSLYARFPEFENHHLWVEGLVAGALGRRVEAEASLQQALAGFLAGQDSEQAELVARDLGALRSPAGGSR